jgi:hypothetical protein
VLVDDQLVGALPASSAWENVGGAQFCLEEAYTALTERVLSDAETLIAEIAPLGPPEDLLAEDDPRCVRLLTLHERLGELVRSHPPDVRTTIAEILDELRDLCRSLGFRHPNRSKP